MADWQDALRSLLPEDFVPETDSAAAPEKPQQKGELHVILDRKRAGKTATIICGFTLPDSDVADLASDLRRHLGVGGSSRNGEILLQGDVRDKAIALLKSRGMKARKI